MNIVNQQQQVIIYNQSTKINQQEVRINGKFCYVVTSRSAQGSYPYGGNYSGGWNGSIELAGINDQNVWTSGLGFLCCN